VLFTSGGMKYISVQMRNDSSWHSRRRRCIALPKQAAVADAPGQRHDASVAVTTLCCFRPPQKRSVHVRVKLIHRPLVLSDERAESSAQIPTTTQLIRQSRSAVGQSNRRPLYKPEAAPVADEHSSSSGTATSDPVRHDTVRSTVAERYQLRCRGVRKRTCGSTGVSVGCVETWAALD
jgi:hypothetical protein